MENEIKISVVIPVYNSSSQLIKTIQSIYDQHFTSYEILLINDGSTSSKSLSLYENIVRDFSKVKLINKKNEGVVRARISGIKQATGNYIIFSDHDDIYLEQGFKKLVDAATKSNADIVVANAFSKTISWLPLKSRVLGIFSHAIIEKDILLKKQYLNFFGYNQFPVATWGKLYKSALLKNIDWDIYDYNFCDDIILNIQIFYNADLVEFIPDIIYTHNYGGITSISDVEVLFKGYADVYNLKSKYIELSDNQENKKFVFFELKNIYHIGLYKFFENVDRDENVIKSSLMKFRDTTAFADLSSFYDQKDNLINLLNREDYDEIIKIGKNHYTSNFVRIKIKNILKKMLTI